MSLPYLRALIGKVAPQTPLWRFPDGTVRSAEDLHKQLESSALPRDVAGRSVAIRANQAAEFAQLLLLVDGVCHQLLVLPRDVDADSARQMIQQTNTDVLVSTDAGLDVAEVCESRVVDLNGAVESSDNVDVHGASGRASRWILATSGTTGNRQLVTHSLASLTRTLKHDFDRGANFVWGSLYGLTSFAGLQVFLQSWCAGSTLVLGGQESSLESRIRQLADGGCNALSATPTMWRKLLMLSQQELAKLSLRQITVGGEIVDQAVLDALGVSFPAARITQIYASTEAGVGFAVNDARAGFPASWLSSPPPGVEISVDRRQHLLLRSTALPDGDHQTAAPDFLDTGDLVEVRGDRCHFLGRADGVINVGGDKVHPEEVERFLVGCVGVHLARVRPRKSSLVGQLVEAEIVPDPAYADDPNRLRKAVLAECRAELAPHKVPAMLNVVDSIQLTDLGKVKR